MRSLLTLILVLVVSQVYGQGYYTSCDCIPVYCVPVYCGCGPSGETTSPTTAPLPKPFMPGPTDSPTPTTERSILTPKPYMPGPTAYQSTSAMLVIDVPAEAQVEINGRVTRSTGQRRSYLTTDLQYDSVYRYNVSVNGVYRTVFLRAGETKYLAFTGDFISPSPILVAKRSR